MLQTTGLPRFGNPPLPGVSYRWRPGAYGVLLWGMQILLTRQTTGKIDDLQLPGGGLDPGEQTLPALIRELREETGYTAIAQRRIGGYRQFTWMDDYGFHAQKICHIYLLRPGLRLGPPEEAGHAAVWMSLRRAARVLPAPGSRRFLLWLLAHRQKAAAPRAACRGRS